jgi:hypothetical protein
MTTNIKCVDGFKHSTDARVLIIPRGNFIEIKEMDHGVWDLIYTTPFACEVEVVPA